MWTSGGPQCKHPQADSHHNLLAGDHFGIGVSGYPEAHPDAIVEDKEQMEKNYWSDIRCVSASCQAWISRSKIGRALHKHFESTFHLCHIFQ